MSLSATQMKTPGDEPGVASVRTCCLSDQADRAISLRGADAGRSDKLAPTFLVFPCFTDAKEIVKLFVDGWQLDYRSPVARGMLDVCVEHLMLH